MTEQALAGRTAIVTGASRGIGRVTALALAGAGADVALAARDTDALDRVRAEAEKLGVRAVATRTDVTRSEDVRAMVADTVAELGRVDILVNNSGVVSSTELLETTDAEWDRVLDTNLRGTFLATREVGRHLVAQGSGKVINMASNFAFKGIPGHAAYSASKAAVVAFTRSMALEWARHGVQVNALAPGYVATDLNADVRADPDALNRILRGVPARRMGRADELAPWIVLLASPASDFMTGETIVIDGGQAAR
ncbi:SDR family NAD(P)-dependent oxidoreductase [Pseudonocardia acaciae]|uniref:SDR family NAD(P)-dependent oxidoreductase n=1 Tax=Pseudonocardia acaciae TaxID=551276 RepID=UPI00048B9D43|nr:glucose 1-dehydrogenase [Pseudonocardia acaciae]